MRLAMLAVFFALLSPCCNAVELTPQAIVEAFFSVDGIQDKKAVYTGEMLHFLNERTMGQYLGVGVDKEYRLLFRSDSAARYAIAVKSPGMTQDWYAFLAKSDGAWRLEAVRTLAQTGLIALLVKRPSRQGAKDYRRGLAT